MLLYTPDAAKTVGLSNKITLGSITGLTATAAGANTIYLSWSGVPGALGYNIYRSTDPNGTFVKITSAPTAATLYRDTTLTPDTNYYYQAEVAGGWKSSAVSAATGGTSGTASSDSTTPPPACISMGWAARQWLRCRTMERQHQRKSAVD